MSKYKILVVDDHIENIQIITRFLENAHPEYRLYQAADGESAIHLSESIPLDLIISDWDMPGITGIELIRLLKSNEKTSHIPVIIATGVMLTSNDLHEALDAGAYDYIRIPVDPVELSARVNSALMLVSCHLKELEKKNSELVEKTMYLIKNNEFNLEMHKKLNSLQEDYDLSEETGELIETIINKLDEKIREDSWQQFEIAFNSLHSGFTKNLVKKYPKLTPAEVKLCIFTKLGMNIKDTASVLYQSPDSLKVSRSRIRKKFKINSEINLQNFLVEF